MKQHQQCCSHRRRVEKLELALLIAEAVARVLELIALLSLVL